MDPLRNGLTLATLVGLSLLLALVGGTTTLLGVLVGRWVRARWDGRHPARAAARQRDRYSRRIAAEWPLLTQTLGLGYRDQWTRQHAYPRAEFAIDDQGVTATVAAIAGPAWPTTSAPPATWPIPGAVRPCGPSSRHQG